MEASQGRAQRGRLSLDEPLCVTGVQEAPKKTNERRARRMAPTGRHTGRWGWAWAGAALSPVPPPVLPPVCPLRALLATPNPPLWPGAGALTHQAILQHPLQSMLTSSARSEPQTPDEGSDPRDCRPSDARSHAICPT